MSHCPAHDFALKCFIFSFCDNKWFSGPFHKMSWNKNCKCTLLLQCVDDVMLWRNSRPPPHFPLNNLLHCRCKRTEQYLAVAFVPSSQQQTRAIFVDSYLLSTTLVDNQNWAEPSTFNIVDNFEQCGQKNIVQYCYTVSSTFLLCVI